MFMVILLERDELEELIKSNQNLVYSIIHKFKGVDVDDLYQAGCLGLINAYKHFDSNYNTKFSTYAYPYIIGEITNYITNNRNIRVSPRNVKLYKGMKKAIDFLTQQLNREPTDQELCTFLEIDLYKLCEIRNMFNLESLDYEYEESNLYNFVGIESLSHDQLLDLKNAFLSLSEEEKDFIIKRYFYNKSQQDLANFYDTNQVKISRDEKKILSKLKAKMC